jgi:hypothetical protein
METGLLAARTVQRGLRERASYEEMTRQYEAEWQRRWAMKRAIGAGVRRLRRHLGVPMRFAPEALINCLWS